MTSKKMKKMKTTSKYFFLIKDNQALASAFARP